MPTRTASPTKLNVFDNGTEATTKPVVRYPSADIAQPAPETLTQEAVRLDPAYVPYFLAVTPWLTAVEQRICNATLPEGYATLEKTEWVSQEVGAAAIRFFQNAADILPGEPFIYASRAGALVAEFAAANGALTTIISPDYTTLFAVKKDQPEDPVQINVKQGSNRLREDLKNISQAITVSHGKMGSTKHR
jgi:hypothetical protein